MNKTKFKVRTPYADIWVDGEEFGPLCITPSFLGWEGVRRPEPVFSEHSWDVRHCVSGAKLSGHRALPIESARELAATLSAIPGWEDMDRYATAKADNYSAKDEKLSNFEAVRDALKEFDVRRKARGEAGE